MPWPPIFRPMEGKRKTLLGVPVDLLSPADFLAGLEAQFGGTGLKTVLAVNPEKIMRARKDPGLLSALRDSDFLIPDGIGTVIGIRLLHGERIARTTGIFLMTRLLAVAAEKKKKVFFFGGRPEVLAEAVSGIRNDFPGLNIVGSQHGYLVEEDYDRLVRGINDSGAELLLVGLGSPKQEKWIHRFRGSLVTKICMGVGGSFDVFAGRVPRAPARLQRLGLEWLFRLVKEPSRLKRQMVLPRYAGAILRQKLRTGVGGLVKRKDSC